MTPWIAEECRFTYEELHVSKEVAREFYRKTECYRDVEEAKRKAGDKGIKDWRNICRSKPPKLNQRLKKIISEMYMAAANELTNRKLFEAPSLAEVIKDYHNYLGGDLSMRSFLTCLRPL